MSRRVRLAPAIALAAHAARQVGGDDALILVLPADHVLQDLASFQAAIRTETDGR